MFWNSTTKLADSFNYMHLRWHETDIDVESKQYVALVQMSMLV